MATKKSPPKKGRPKKVASKTPKKPKKGELNVEAIESLAAKYEDILEPKILALYYRIANFIAASQLPVVHVVTVLELLKRAAVDQLRVGYKIKD